MTEIDKKPCYMLSLSSRNSNATVNTANSSVSFNVNLNPLLPLEYTKFRCNVVLKSELSALVSTECGTINIDFTNPLISNGSSNIKKVGYVYPISYYSGVVYYCYFTSTLSDNLPFEIMYPFNSTYITVTFTTFAGSLLANLPHWTLMMSFEPIF